MDCNIQPAVRLKWQPCTAAGADTPWLIVGQSALDCKTLATTTLGGADVLWAVWCGDGIHAVLLQITNDGEAQRQRHIGVYHVASGTLITSRACVDVPGMCKEEAFAERYVPSGAEVALVPASLHAVILCRLPSLEEVAQLASPVMVGELVSMGWAAKGSLIALAWHLFIADVAVTV